MFEGESEGEEGCWGGLLGFWREGEGRNCQGSCLKLEGQRGKLTVRVMLDVDSNNRGWELLDEFCLMFGGRDDILIPYYRVLLSSYLFIC